MSQSRDSVVINKLSSHRLCVPSLSFSRSLAASLAPLSCQPNSLILVKLPCPATNPECHVEAGRVCHVKATNLELASEAGLAPRGAPGGTPSAGRVVLSPGDRVSIRGVERRIELNGEVGVLVEHDPARQRWTVRRSNEEVLSLSEGVLSAVPGKAKTGQGKAAACAMVAPAEGSLAQGSLGQARGMQEGAAAEEANHSAYHLVVDSCSLLDPEELQALHGLHHMGCTLVVPWRVLREVDTMRKDEQRGPRARTALRFIQEHCIGQKPHERCDEKTIPLIVADDEVRTF